MPIKTTTAITKQVAMTSSHFMDDLRVTSYRKQVCAASVSLFAGNAKGLWSTAGHEAPSESIRIRKTREIGSKIAIKKGQWLSAETAAPPDLPRQEG